METIDFSNWPAWLIITVLALNLIKWALNLFKVPLSKTFPALFGILTSTSADKLKDAEHKRMQEIRATEYERVQKSFHKDKTFELLEATIKSSHENQEDTLKFLRENQEASREDAKAQLKQNQEMFKGISRQAASIDQLTGIVRILSQNAANHDDKLGDVSQSVARTDDRVSRIEQQIDKGSKNDQRLA